MHLEEECEASDINVESSWPMETMEYKLWK
jgi:hypothetical protein